MKIVLGVLVGVAVSKPLLKIADKYVAKSAKVRAAEKIATLGFEIRNRALNYIKDYS